MKVAHKSMPIKWIHNNNQCRDIQTPFLPQNKYIPDLSILSKSMCNSSSLSKFLQSSPPLSWWMPPFISLDLSNTNFKNFSSPSTILELLVQIGEAYFLSSRPTAKSRKSKESKLIKVIQISHHWWWKCDTLVKLAPRRSDRISQFKPNTN